jgi:uncharacterized protein YodC (DUF2158 family)
MQSERSFKFGDVVTFKSGGPNMVVTIVSDWIHCDWFDAVGIYHNATFPPAILRHVIEGSEANASYLSRKPS